MSHTSEEEGGLFSQSICLTRLRALWMKLYLYLLNQVGRGLLVEQASTDYGGLRVLKECKECIPSLPKS